MLNKYMFGLFVHDNTQINKISAKVNGRNGLICKLNLILTSTRELDKQSAFML